MGTVLGGPGRSLVTRRSNGIYPSGPACTGSFASRWKSFEVARSRELTEEARG